MDAALERSYLHAMAGPGRQRLGIACFLGAALWLMSAILGPPLLHITAGHVYVAALIAGGGNVAGVLLTRTTLTLPQAWLVALVTTGLSAMCIVAVTWLDGVFLEIGAPALMLNGIFALGVVRLTAWVAAALALFEVGLFVFTVVELGTGSTGAFQAFLLVGTVSVATVGSRYLEAAERTAFSQSQLVADLYERIDRLFRQYLSPDVAQALVDDPARADLGGEVAEVSILFADLRGYTSFSERTPPNEVVAMLNAAFGEAVPAVFAEGGTIVQFMGDALMAIFNAPVRQPDHALRACRAGLALQHSTGAVLGDAGGPRFRVGINTGAALVGNIGSVELRNFSALGDTTNVAARLQTYADPGSVVLGERTYELVRDVAEVRHLGAPELKGKSLPIEMYELIALRSAQTA
jgi:class 3 adenylate cyclase